MAATSLHDGVFLDSEKRRALRLLFCPLSSDGESGCVRLRYRDGKKSIVLVGMLAGAMGRGRGGGEGRGGEGRGGRRGMLEFGMQLQLRLRFRLQLRSTCGLMWSNFQFSIFKFGVTRTPNLKNENYLDRNCILDCNCNCVLDLKTKLELQLQF